jgi:predicted amidohydrolase
MTIRRGDVHNTALVFDRGGRHLLSYHKVHLPEEDRDRYTGCLATRAELYAEGWRKVKRTHLSHE